MKPRTPYVATCTWAAPAMGMRLQNWVNNRERMEVDGEARVVGKSNLKGVVVRPVGAYNKTFGVYINKLATIKQTQ